MKIPSRVSGVVSGFATSGALAAGVIFPAPVLSAHRTAGDVSAKSAESLNIAGSIAEVTPQPSERGWLRNSRMSGRVPNHPFERRLEYSTRTRVGNKVAVT